MPRDVGVYLAEQQRKSSGDVASEWGNIEELYNKKYVWLESYTISMPDQNFKLFFLCRLRCNFA